LARSRRIDALAAIVGLFATLIAQAPAALAEPSAARQALRFSRGGEPVRERTIEWMREVAPAAVVRVHEPYESREIPFDALPFPDLLDAVYGPSWREAEEILLTCSDGYAPTVPVARVLDHRAWLAFARTDQPGFSVEKRESGALKAISLAPFYLVWENLDDPTLRQEADYGWPYQLVAIDLIRARERFPKMAPPEESSPEVRKGFSAFRIHCSKCHPLNGEGGSIGPELNAVAAPVEYRDPAWLRGWIEDPSRIRPDARMPALNPALPDRAAVVDQILAYLAAMARARDEAPDS
jgi:mono/diheme cytochrome c family protein